MTWIIPAQKIRREMRMSCRGIVLSAVIMAACLIVTGETFGSSIYFDVDSDLVADTEHRMGVGQDVVVSVCLSDFTEETGSFQFDIFYDGSVLELLDYDTYMGQPDEDPGLTGIIQTKAELGPWGTSQWSEPVTQEVNEYDSGAGSMREFYTAGSLTETATGDGILAYLVFDAVGVGETTLDLEMPGGTWFLEDISAQPQAINMTVNVVPEPSMAALILFAIPFLLVRYKNRT